MARRRLWLLPTLLLAGGAAATTLLAVLPFLGVRTRNVLILGLDTSDWYFVALFAGLAVVIVGLFSAAMRLRGGWREGLSLLLGVVAALSTALLVAAGVLYFALSGISERTEIGLADGKSLVVERFSWHHCDVTVFQRDGVFVDTVLGSTLDGMSCGSVGSGDYLVNQVGDRVTLTDGTGNMTVNLH